MPTSPPERAGPTLWQWIILGGGAGFAAGFFGPIALVPGANQGPLLGIFISGPASAAIGVCLFIAVTIARLRGAYQWRVLWTFTALACLTTLYFCLPGPAYKGYLIDAQVESCSTPAQVAGDAIASWTKRVADATWAAPRAGWQAEARLTLESDSAAVIALAGARSNRIYENRKPWNRGSSVAEGWRTASAKTYYVKGSCAEFPNGVRVRRFALYDADVQLARGSRDWPPRASQQLLGLETLEPIAPAYEGFVERR